MHESPLSRLDHRLLVTVTQILTTWQVDAHLHATLLGWDATVLQDARSDSTLVHQSPEQVERLLLTVELIRAVHGRHGHAETWWLHHPNPAPPFNGQTPLAYLSSGEPVALQATVQHLDDALRGGVPPSKKAVEQAATLPQPDINLEE